MKKVATAGNGNVGSAQERGLTRAGYDVGSTEKENEETRDVEAF
jgi:predicted dinucleotide-binding enzyme